MTVRNLSRAAAMAALLTLPQGLAAQEAAAPAEAGTPPPAGEPYVVSQHRDWEVVCSLLTPEGPELCEMYQLLLDPTQQPIAEISIVAFPQGNEVAGGVTITTPLETFLPPGLAFRIGAEGDTRLEPFRVCTVVGCIVRMGLSETEIDAMKRGANAFITILPFVAPDQPVELPISLSGFTAAFDETRSRLPAAGAVLPDGTVIPAPAGD
jgi:invasion protein IalB